MVTPSKPKTHRNYLSLIILQKIIGNQSTPGFLIDHSICYLTTYVISTYLLSIWIIANS